MDDTTTKTPARRLTKKPPPSTSASAGIPTSAAAAATPSVSPYLVADRRDHHHNLSVQLHAHHQLHSQRSSASLQRSPSAPTFPRYHPPPAHGRARTGSVNPASSNSSLDRDRERDRDRRSSGISGPSPNLAAPDSVAPSGPGGGQRLSNPTRPLTEKPEKTSDDEFIGAPFDGSEILDRLDATKAAGYHTSLRKPPPPPLAQPASDPLMAELTLQHSASFSSSEKSSEKSTPRVGENQLISPKRYSDEGKEPRQGMIRKKSGFSGFMSSIGVGSPRGVKISAPENPVHVTHVGYDNQTGQFTVRPLPPADAPAAANRSRVFPRSGNG